MHLFIYLNGTNIGGNQKLPGHSPRQAALGDPA